MSQTAKTLYADRANNRFFHIPDDADLASGDLVLRSLTGQQLEVQEAAAAPFMVPEAEAKKLAAAKMEEVAKKAKGLMSGLGAMMRQVAENQRKPDYDPREKSPRETTAADFLGVTPEQLRSDPEAVMAGLKKVFAGLQQSVRDAVDDRPEAQEATKERVRMLAGMTGAELDGTEESLQKMIETIKEKLRDPELEKRVRESSERLEKVAAELRGEAEET